MPDRSLQNCHVLVVEDEYMMAEDLVMALEDAGAVILGPAGTLADALNMIAAELRIDGAILDVNLRGEMVFSAADLLAERKVPFVFTSGYDASVFPARFTDAIRCEKPVNLKLVAEAIGRLIHT